jgi:hypothetical protein
MDIVDIKTIVFLTGWMDGWMGGLVGGWVEGWMDGWMQCLQNILYITNWNTQCIPQSANNMMGLS